MAGNVNAFTVEQVSELWSENADIAERHLGVDDPRARRAADEMTRRQVGDEAWAAFERRVQSREDRFQADRRRGRRHGDGRGARRARVRQGLPADLDDARGPVVEPEALLQETLDQLDADRCSAFLTE